MYAWAWGAICFVGVSILVGCGALDAPVAVITEIDLTRCAGEGEREGRGQRPRLEGEIAALVHIYVCGDGGVEGGQA